jgi:hypothetical protein
VGESSEFDPSRAQIGEHPPIQQKSRGWWLECRRPTGYASPHVPQRKRLFDVSVLNRLAMLCDPMPDGVGGPVEAKQDEARVPQSLDDDGVERPEVKPIAGVERGRRQPVLGANAVVAGTECNGREFPHIVELERPPCGQPDLQWFAARSVDARQARGDGRRVVRDEQIARAEKGRQPTALRMPHRAVGLHQEQPGIRRALRRLAGCLHAALPLGESRLR